MRPRATVLALAALAVLAGGGAVAAGGPAVAGGETCGGLPATIVGTPGGEIDGTDGPDVIVTNGAEQVDAGDGDDVVCVTGGAERTFAFLGAGDDAYTGGPGADHVEASDPWETPRAQGADVVSTAGGDDSVTTGGAPGDADHDQVDLGDGDDEAVLDGPVDATLPIVGGNGADQLELSRSTMRRAWVIDNSAGNATVDGAPVVTWSSLEAFEIGPWGRWTAPSFIGGDGAERVSSYVPLTSVDLAGAERVSSYVPLTSVDLAGGDDRLRMHLHTRRLVDDATYAGGDGVDAFVLNAEAGDQARRVDLDLVAGTLLFRPDDDQGAVHAAIGAFERYRFSARRLDILGTPGPDHLMWSGCHGEVAGGAGDDLLEILFIPDASCGYNGEDADLVARGGRGDDTLVGEYMPDILLGGPGHDSANGKRGTDRCVAEVETRCDR